MKDERYFDSRVVETHISRGRITRKDYETWLANLEDCSERSKKTESVMVASDQDGKTQG